MRRNEPNNDNHVTLTCVRCGKLRAVPAWPFHCCRVMYLYEGHKGIAGDDTDWLFLPCLHRGDKLRDEPCQLCGNREELVPIFTCAIHGECSLRKFKFREKVIKSCLTCEERVEPAA